MKLKFTIPYATQWGEQLHVVMAYHSADGTRRTSNLPMNTQDGLVWTLETSVIESRQHPINSIVYNYQVEDGDGQVVRREWAQIARTYFFDASKHYVFDDEWRDMPLCSHLYSRAYLTTQHARQDEHAESRRTPLYRRTALFRVAAPQLQDGQCSISSSVTPALSINVLNLSSLPFCPIRYCCPSTSMLCPCRWNINM